MAARLLLCLSFLSCVIKMKDTFQRHLRLLPLYLCVTFQNLVNHDGDTLN